MADGLKPENIKNINGTFQQGCISPNPASSESVTADKQKTLEVKRGIKHDPPWHKTVHEDSDDYAFLTLVHRLFVQ
jgi:hypothetical protein